MNQNFAAQEAVERKEEKGNEENGFKEMDDDLALFFAIQKCEMNLSNLSFLGSLEELDTSPGSKPKSSPILKNATSPLSRKTDDADDILNFETDTNDYEWLLASPRMPIFSSPDTELPKSVLSQIGSPEAHSTTSKSRSEDLHVELPSGSNFASRQLMSSPGPSPRACTPSSPGGPGSATSRPVTPTGCTTAPSSMKSSRPATPTSKLSPRSSKPLVPTARLSNPSARYSTLAVRSSTSSARSSTPAVRSSAPSSRSTPAVKSSIPSARSSSLGPKSSTPSAKSSTLAPRPSTPPLRSSAPAARSSTPFARSSTPATRPRIPASRSISRSTTPTKRSSTLRIVSSAPVPAGRSSSVTRSGSTASRNPETSGGSSTMKSRPWKPSERPQNLRISEKSHSTSRGRTGAPSVRTSGASERNGTLRQQSNSPLRGRPPNGNTYSNRTSVDVARRAHSYGSDNVTPGLIGTKMVERVVNMRKLAPPKQDECTTNSGRRSILSQDSGFGTTLSKKSLDMALRHMEVRQGIPGKQRTSVTNISASSMYSMRSGPARRIRTLSASDLPLPTSNFSSELSVNDNTRKLKDEYHGSDKGEQFSPRNQCRR